MKINLIEMGGRIRKVRGKISLDGFEKILGVSRSSISLYERGAAWPKPETLSKIIEFGGITYDWLFVGKEPTKEPVPTQVTYPLAEDEKRAVHTAEDLLKYKGLDQRFAVVEVHHPPPEGERLSDEEKELLEAFRQVDQSNKNMILQVANNAALAFNQGGGRSRPEEGGSLGANCA